MGILQEIAGPVVDRFTERSTAVVVLALLAAGVVLVVVANVLKQLLFRKPNEPPVVFHWLPLLGSTVEYGMDPYRFFFRCREKYGDVFTFILLGRKTTVCLGTKGNDTVLNAKAKDVNAEEVYGPFTSPVFGKDVIYDCPNAKLIEQKKFVKSCLSTDALRSYVPVIAEEVLNYVKHSPHFKGSNGLVNLPQAMAEITLYTASVTLQGKEVREKLDSTFATLFHDLDNGFQPLNLLLPWLPIPQNRKRDAAHHRVTEIYMDLIKARRANGDRRSDLIGALTACAYKDGTPVPDEEIAHMMIGLLMAGQHSSSSTGSWMMLRLASRPEILEELYQEQIRVLGPDLPPLTYDNLPRLQLHQDVLKETLRLHAPIHSMLRVAKSPIVVEGTPYVVPQSHLLLSAPGVTSRDERHFPNPWYWDPHRWEEAGNQQHGSDEKEDYGFGVITKGTNSPYLPFGAGRHRCIGEQYAYLQLAIILALLVREFRVKNLGGRTDVVPTDYSSLFSRPQNPAYILWERREKSAASE